MKAGASLQQPYWPYELIWKRSGRRNAISFLLFSKLIITRRKSSNFIRFSALYTVAIPFGVLFSCSIIAENILFSESCPFFLFHRLDDVHGWCGGKTWNEHVWNKVSQSCGGLWSAAPPPKHHRRTGLIGLVLCYW